MATWITHLRIAETLVDHYDLCRTSFIVGNIGPDCGVPNETYTAYEPGKSITHFLPKAESNGSKINGTLIEAERFYNTYLHNQTLSREKYSFLMGYYVHLKTDIAWSAHHREKKKDPIYAEKVSKLENYTWRVKQDWYGLDFEYLELFKDHCFYTDFLNVKSVEDYLDYFPKDAFTKQVHYIQKFYQNDSDNYVPTGEFMTLDEMNTFVKNTTQSLKSLLNERCVS